MARGVKWGCSYKKTTLIVCSVNIVVALCVLRSLYASLYFYSSNNDLSDNVVKYTPDQIRMMEESIRIRRAKQPTELVKIVKEIKEELSREESVVELTQEVKNRIAEEIIQRLRGLKSKTNITQQQEVVESWRKEKLQEVKNLTRGSGTLNSSLLQEEARLLSRALETNWGVLSESIGLFVPTQVVNKEHDDKPEGEDEEEEEILPGRRLPPECGTELHTDYDGAAVRWGLTHHKDSAADCCQACLDQAKNPKPDEKRCNTWVYCPSEYGCYSPDIYEHKNGECWLKYAEIPKLNFKDTYSESYRNSHPNAPLVVPWVSGIITVSS